MNSHHLELKAGEWVEVRTRQEILSTLDANGVLDGLPFMPEMFEFCGRRLRVYKRAHKTCDTINWTGSRRMTHAVHLEDIRCSGKAHGDCQADCLIFWKEAWLKRVSGPPASVHPQESPHTESPVGPSASPALCSERALVARACKQIGDRDDDRVYSCQATELLKATTPLAAGDWRQYWEDFSSGNYSLSWMLGVGTYAGFNSIIWRFKPGGWISRVLFWMFNGIQLLRGKVPKHPRACGIIPAGAPTPSASLRLQPGEMVRVKSFNFIRTTIDENYKNRGMKWDAEMVPYCGGVYRVRKRVSQIIDEKTGKMLRLKSEPIILEGVTCQSKYSDCRYFCPRSVYAYWREIWLERVAPPPPQNAAASAQIATATQDATQT